MVHAGPGRECELEDFAIFIRDDTQVQKDVPAAAQPVERAAGDVQVEEVPAAAQPQERAAGDVQVQTTPAAATREELAATTHFRWRRRVMQPRLLHTPTCFKWKM